MLGISVIGYGYWGPNLVRNFSQVPNVRVVSVCDQRPERRAYVESVYPAIKTCADVRDVWSNPAIAPQQKGWMCVSVRAEAWSAESFAALGAAAYAAAGAALFAFGRFLVGGGGE